MKDSLGNEVPSRRIWASLFDDLGEIQQHNMAVLKTKLAIIDGKHVEYSAAAKTTIVTDHTGQTETIKFP